MSSSTQHASALESLEVVGAVAKPQPTAESAFVQLDEIAQRPDAFGVVRVTTTVGMFAATMRHLHRRSSQHGRPTWSIGAAETMDVWRLTARHLGVGLSGDLRPSAVARELANAATGGVLIVAEHRQTTWGGLVRDELSRLAQAADRSLLLIVLANREESLQGTRVGTARPASLGMSLNLGQLSEEDHRRWWSAVVYQDTFATQPAFEDLASLDQWWETTKTRPIDAPYGPDLSDEAAALRHLLAHAQQALSPRQLSILGSTAESARALDELLGLQIAQRNAAGAVNLVGAHHPQDALSRASTRRLTEALAADSTDGWALMRAAELSAAAGDGQQAEDLALAAVSAIGDTAAREDLWRRWEHALEGMAADGVSTTDRLGRLVRSAERALALGDGERADRMAREAMRIRGDSFDVLLLHGRTSHARGDVTTAALSLSRAMSAAANDGDRARAAGLMAQVRFMAGDPKQAEKFADQAIAHGPDVVTRLDGRNVLGKLLLAREAWKEAEEHFAQDAYEAAVADVREEELRARLNRGISVLYLGRREQAREMLEEVLRDGEHHGVLRAVAFTLSNLATIAILEHRYERALALSERAIEVRRRIGGRLGLVQPITNLAELRLRLGLIAEAEQSLRFGLHACGHALPLSRYAFFAKLAACIHLERGETTKAAKELATAISGASCSGDKSQLAQCHRISARIALEDGDLARARAALAAADQLRHTSFGRAELEVIRGEVMQAAGEPFIDIARGALVLAQEADDPESIREAHALLYCAYSSEGDEASAVSHLRSARRVVQRISESMAEPLAKRYLRRPAIMKLDDLSALSAVEDEPTDTRRERERSNLSPEDQRRPLVGDSAPMRSLRGTIRRVAKTSTTVLISGETGTGKELVAEALHRASDRAQGPMVKVNCAALVETLLLSELFGHEKGAFTGASTRRRGRFEVAEGGTLFLDEIGDISPRTQVALLRVLQDGTFERVGGCTQLRSNVRIVCATHRDLKAMVARGEFREDLYYRLCGVVLEVPALKERASDLPALCHALLTRAEATAGIELRPLSDEAVATLSRHPWPGNVRELENALRVAALFAKGDYIELSDFTDNVEGLRGLVEGATDSSPGRATLPPPAFDGDDGSVTSIAPGPRSVSPRSARAAHASNLGGPPSHAPESLPPASSSTDLVYAEIRGGLKLAEMKKKLEHECIARALVESGGNITKAAALLGMKRPRLSQLVKQYKLSTVLEDIKS